MNHKFVHRDAPLWLCSFVDQSLPGLLDAALIGCHYFHNVPTDEWEISLFELPTEICGGAADGMQVLSGLRIDLAAVLSAFDSISSLYWQVARICDDDELGNHLSFEGTTGGNRVWLRILRDSPSVFGVGQKVDVAGGTIEDTWSY